MTLHKGPNDAPVTGEDTVVGRNRLRLPEKLNWRHYAFALIGALVLAGGIIIFAASPGTTSTVPLQANCFASPGSCGYPDPAYHNVGVTNCSSLTPSAGFNADTPGETISGKNISGQVNINASNVTLTNDCVLYNGQSTTGEYAVNVQPGVNGTTITNSTIGGVNATRESVQAAIGNDSGGSNTTATGDYLYNCSECIHGTWTVNNSYVISNGFVTGDGTTNTGDGNFDHYEDWYFNDGTISANHDTMFNPVGQTAIIFGDTNGGGGGPADNHLTLTDSFIGGGGYMFYANGNSSSAGSSTMDITNNRFARCLTTPVYDPSGGGNNCKSGADTHGYSPGGGYYGPVDTETVYSGANRIWSNNFWDDDLNVVDGQGNTTTAIATPFETTTSPGSPTPPATTLPPPTNPTPPPTADTTPPSVPAGLSAAAATSAQVNLSWKAASDNVGVSAYKIYRNGSSAALATVTAPAVTYQDDAVSAGTSYRYQITAVDAAGNVSAESTAVSVATPPASDKTAPSVPTNLHSTKVTASSIALAWNASKDSGAAGTAVSGLAGYHLYRSDSKHAAKMIASPPINSYLDSNLSAGTSYTYSVSAYDKDANGSKTVAAAPIKTLAVAPPTPPSPPNAPINLSAAAATSAQINLSWSAPTGGTAAAKYLLYRNGTTTPYRTVTAPMTSYQDDTVSAGTVYRYQVAAVDAAGDQGAKSASVSVTTPLAPDKTAPSTPANLVASSITTTSIILSWGASHDNSGGSGLAGYHLYRSDSKHAAALIASPNTTKYTDTKLNPGTTYTYWVSAYDQAANGSAASNEVHPATLTTVSPTPPPPPAILPSTPSGLKALSVNASSTMLTWNAATDKGGPGIKGYRLYRDGTLVVALSDTSYTDTGLTAGTTYSYTVTAFDKNNHASAASAPFSIRTSGKPPAHHHHRHWWEFWWW